jgi:hypothetical protein
MYAVYVAYLYIYIYIFYKIIFIFKLLIIKPIYKDILFKIKIINLDQIRTMLKFKTLLTIGILVSLVYAATSDETKVIQKII